MKFSIDKDRLNDTLTAVAAIIPQRSTLPILSTLLLELEGNRLRITATDLDVYVVTDVEADGSEDGVVTVPGRRFFEIVKELPSEQLSLVTDANQTTLTCGRRTYRFLGMTATDFPAIPTSLSGTGVELPVAALLRGLQHTTFAVSTDEARPNLQGALVQISADGLRLVASDSHRLVRYDFPGLTGEPLKAIVPLKTLQLLLRNLASSDGVAVLELAGNYIACSYDNTRVYSRILEGPFPDYEKVIPSDNTNVFTLDREEGIRALRRVSVLSHSQTHQVRLSVEKGALSIATNTPEVGDAVETIDIDYEGEQIDIGFNAVYLLEVLRHIASPNIVIRLGGSTHAGLLTPESIDGDESYLCLVMPLRLYSHT
ncbi:MAG: DNA polymerase III subunit beta [Gemmatimonadetes bacterium]|nr:DNA polymerase III subunit beta [Gemmatimonadota bacterium]